MSGLREAYELIRNEDHWCQGAMARDERGHSVGVGNEGARQFCASGAFVRAHCTEAESRVLVAAALALCPEIPEDVESLFGPVVWVNDNLGHEAVLQVFEKALIELEGSL